MICGSRRPARGTQRHRSPEGLRCSYQLEIIRDVRDFFPTQLSWQLPAIRTRRACRGEVSRREGGEALGQISKEATDAGFQGALKARLYGVQVALPHGRDEQGPAVQPQGRVVELGDL